MHFDVWPESARGLLSLGSLPLWGHIHFKVPVCRSLPPPQISRQALLLSIGYCVHLTSGPLYLDIFWTPHVPSWAQDNFVNPPPPMFSISFLSWAETQIHGMPVPLHILTHFQFVSGPAGFASYFLNFCPPPPPRPVITLKQALIISATDPDREAPPLVSTTCNTPFTWPAKGSS